MSGTYFQEVTAELRRTLPGLIEEMEQQVPYASVGIFSKASTRLSVDFKQESIEPEKPTVGAVITVYDGERLWEHATHILEFAHLREKALELVQKALPIKQGPAIVPSAPLEGHFEASAKRRPEDVSLREKLETLRERVSFAKSIATEQIVNFIGNYNEMREQKLFVDRTRCVSEDVTRLAFFGIFLATNGQGQEYDACSSSAAGDFDAAKLTDEMLIKTRDNAIVLLEAERIPPGTYDCISSPAVSGLIAHEAFGHGTEVDMFLKDRSKGQEFLGRQIASPLVTMYDDPSIAGAYGSHFIDDQGQVSSRTTVIENGVLTQGIGDLYSTSVLNLPRTSNGRRENYLRKAYSRMTNTYFAPGEATLEEMMKDIEHGIYLESAESGMEDPKGWGIQCTIHLGREIKNGEFTGKIYKSLALTGYVPELLGSISMVGNDFELHSGGCGKGHKEFVPVTDGGPHLRLRGRLG